MQGLPRPVWHRSRRHASAAVRARPARFVPAVPVPFAAPFASVPVASAPPLPPLRHVATADRAAKAFRIPLLAARPYALAAALGQGIPAVPASCRRAGTQLPACRPQAHWPAAVVWRQPAASVPVAHCAAAVPHCPRTAAPGTVPLGVHARRQKAPSPAPRSPAVRADPAAPIAVPAPMPAQRVPLLWPLPAPPVRVAAPFPCRRLPRCAALVAAAAAVAVDAVAAAGVRVAATGAVRAANWPVAARSRPTRSAGGSDWPPPPRCAPVAGAHSRKRMPQNAVSASPDDVVPAHSKGSIQIVLQAASRRAPGRVPARFREN